MRTLRRRVGQFQGCTLLCAVGLIITLLPTVALPQDASAGPPLLSPPKSLEGTVTVSQSHATSLDPTEGTFSGYKATATFSDLTFGKGSGEPYKLLHGNISYSGFDVTQTVPGTNGQCVATYHFSLEPGQPLSGNLSFNETGDQAHANLELGLVATGAITAASGCGPYDEGTSHVFGQPIKISFAFSDKGDWNQDTGAAVFNDTTSYPYLGGTEVDKVKGKLGGGLQIWFTENGKKPVNVTYQNPMVVVGEEIHLKAMFADGSTPTLTGDGWTGITSPGAVDFYQFHDTKAEVYPLETGDLKTKPDITFYWWKGRAESDTENSGGYEIQVTGKNQKTGVEDTAETTFDVVTPNVNTFSATTCGVGINRSITIPDSDISPLELGIGYTNGSGCLGKPGIKWNIDVAMPKIDGGHIALTQVANLTVKLDNKTCTLSGLTHDDTAVTYTANGKHLSADAGRSYLAEEPHYPAGGDWKPDLSDSPRTGLGSGTTKLRADTFTDYIMFEPDGTNSIWVALAQMGPWSWSGTAEKYGGVWSLTAHQDPQGTSTALPTSLPEWGGAIPVKQQTTVCK